jgi:hypothetical protein
VWRSEKVTATPAILVVNAVRGGQEKPRSDLHRTAEVVITRFFDDQLPEKEMSAFVRNFAQDDFPFGASARSSAIDERRLEKQREKKKRETRTHHSRACKTTVVRGDSNENFQM